MNCCVSRCLVPFGGNLPLEFLVFQLTYKQNDEALTLVQPESLTLKRLSDGSAAQRGPRAIEDCPGFFATRDGLWLPIYSR